MPSQVSKRKLIDVREVSDDANSSEARWLNLGKVELRDDRNGDLHLVGYASTFDEYEMYGGPENYGWIEQLSKDAFNRTLSEKPDLQLLINHGGMPLARTTSGNLTLTVDQHGLHVDALLDRTDPDVQALMPKMLRGDMDQMSFAFRVKAQEWSAAPGFEDDPMSKRLITEVSLQKGDVSIVNYGANPHTQAELATVGGAIGMLAHAQVSELRSVDGGELRAALRNLATLSNRADLDDDPNALLAGLDATLDEAVNLIAAFNRDDVDADVLQVFDLVVAAESLVDELMEVSGVVDPDDDEQEAATRPPEVRKRRTAAGSTRASRKPRAVRPSTIARGLRIEVSGDAKAPEVRVHDASGLLDEGLCAVLCNEVREAVLGHRGAVTSHSAPTAIQGYTMPIAQAQHLTGRTERVQELYDQLGIQPTVSIENAEKAAGEQRAALIAAGLVAEA